MTPSNSVPRRRSSLPARSSSSPLSKASTYIPIRLCCPATLVVLSSMIISQGRGQQNPSIVHITPGQAVDLGDTVDLSCSVQYGSNYPIIWTKLSDSPTNPPLFISRDAALTVLDNRYSIRHDDSSSTYTLQVSKVSSHQCQLSPMLQVPEINQSNSCSLDSGYRYWIISMSSRYKRHKPSDSGYIYISPYSTPDIR